MRRSFPFGVRFYTRRMNKRLLGVFFFERNKKREMNERYRRSYFLIMNNHG